MKYIKLVPSVILLTTGLLGLWFFWLSPLIKEYKLEPGQTYEMIFDEDNPFNKPIIKHYRVLDYKDDYILYIDSEYQDTFAMRANLFLFNSKCTNCD